MCGILDTTSSTSGTKYELSKQDEVRCPMCREDWTDWVTSHYCDRTTEDDDDDDDDDEEETTMTETE